MKTCDTCELRGYSRELCLVHLRHCRKHPERHPAPASVRIGARTAAGLALGVTAGLLVATAASFVGGPALFYALMPKLVGGGGILGGGWGLGRGVADTRERAAPPPPLRRRPTRTANPGPGRTR